MRGDPQAEGRSGQEGKGRRQVGSHGHSSLKAAESGCIRARREDRSMEPGSLRREATRQSIIEGVTQRLGSAVRHMSMENGLHRDTGGVLNMTDRQREM